MCKLTHVIRYTVQSKFVIFAVLERRLIHGVITGYRSQVSLIGQFLCARQRRVFTFLCKLAAASYV